MNYNLIKIFVDRNIIKEETELKLKYTGVGLDGDINVECEDFFLIEEIKELNNKHIYSFKVRSTRDGEVSYNTSDNIMEVDGMDLVRYSAAYDLDLNGDFVPPPPKRGRKTKEELARLAALADDDDFDEEDES